MDGSKDGALQPRIMPHERPTALLPLFAPLRGLRGVGPALERRLGRLLASNDPTVLDLLTHLPTSYLDTRPAESLSPLDEGSARTLAIVVTAHHPSAGGRRPGRVSATSKAGEIDLVFFGLPDLVTQDRFPINAHLLVHGRLQRFGERWQMAHPEILREAEAGTPLAIYPLTEGMHQGSVRGVMRRALGKLRPIPEWHEPQLMQAAGPAFDAALRAVHAGPDPIAEARLAMDELVAGQLGLLIARRAREQASGRIIIGNGILTNRLLEALPFQLTDHQQDAIVEILQDMASENAMLRLLQGDVGSGKTLVALMAMLTAVEAGHQAALMAPTDVLATQHASGLCRLLAPLGLQPLLLAARVKGKERAKSWSAFDRANLQSWSARMLCCRTRQFSPTWHWRSWTSSTNSVCANA